MRKYSEIVEKLNQEPIEEVKKYSVPPDLVPTYYDIYEEAIQSILKQSLFSLRDDIDIIEETTQLLKQKRDNGIAKYGSDSFQNSFIATVSSPYQQHLLEELYDSINYCAHAIYVNRSTTFDEELNLSLKHLLEDIISILFRTQDMWDKFKFKNKEQEFNEV